MNKAEKIFLAKVKGHNITAPHVIVHRPYQGIVCDLVTENPAHYIVYAEGKLLQVPKSWLKPLPKKHLQKATTRTTLEP